MSADGRWRCATCSAEPDEDDDLPLVVEGELRLSAEGAPRVAIDDETWSWAELGQALTETLARGRILEVHLRGVGLTVEQGTEVDGAPERDGVATVSPIRPREPEDDGGRAEALALLAECLPPPTRHPRPDHELAVAAARIRRNLYRPELPWSAVAAGAGWGRAPDDDHDLWLDAALSLIEPRRPLPLPEEVQACLAALERDDWLSTIIELTRAGAGTPVDPQSLLVLSARCMDVDSGAVDPESAAMMAVVFDMLIPVLRAVGAVGEDGTLTELGAWGLPLALARAWGGDLERASEPVD